MNLQRELIEPATDVQIIRFLEKDLEEPVRHAFASVSELAFVGASGGRVLVDGLIEHEAPVMQSMRWMDARTSACAATDSHRSRTAASAIGAPQGRDRGARVERARGAPSAADRPSESRFVRSREPSSRHRREHRPSHTRRATNPYYTTARRLRRLDRRSRLPHMHR